MKNTTRYAADITTNMENGVRQIQPEPILEIHSALPTTTQKIADYVEQLLTKDEQAVCDMATD